MAINQAEIFSKLEKLYLDLNKDQYFYSFLEIFGFPSATISRLKSGERNIAQNPQSGEIAFKKGIYFKPVAGDEDIYKIAETLKKQPVVTKENIRFIFITNWVDVVAHDLKADEKLECTLEAINESYSFFLPLAGYEKALPYTESPADTKAAEQMGKLFDLIKEKNKPQSPEDIHALNVFLTRLLFCFFAEDTGIFKSNQLTSTIDSTTKLDGSDLANFFKDLFEVLNEPENSNIRLSKPAHFKNFPYVNGGLFRQPFPIPEFTNKARRILLDCGVLQWQDINPDIFGSMFQAVIDEDQRGNLGQHYTSVANILKVIQPLFIDKLNDELFQAKNSESKLKKLLERIAQIKIFDPACGSGNFLIIAYKELRKIEMQVFKALDEVTTQKVMFMSGIRLNQFYGIEIDDFAHEIALLSLWLTEHQMNQAFQKEFGYCPPSLPLKESGNIVAGNSLRLDWTEVCPRTAIDEVYVCGNPPFLGHARRNDSQNEDMEIVLKGFDKFGRMDYVGCWFWKSAQYIENTKTEVSLVATNSICQGVQVELLWAPIIKKGIKINFAYQGFPWKNSARENAGVHVIILGLGSIARAKKQLYLQTNNEWHVESPLNINPYLLAAPDIIVYAKNEPFSDVPKMLFGSMPRDGGHLFLAEDERRDIINSEPQASKWIKRCLGADEFLNGGERYCLWLEGITAEELNTLPLIKARIEKVKEMRSASKAASTRDFAKTPHLFAQRSHPNKGHYILVPYTTSERRNYVPVGFYDENVVSTNLNNIIPNGTLYEAGLLMSTIHIEWMKTVGGRLETRYRYSAQLVYNTYPWPSVNEKQKKLIEEITEQVLMIRERYPEKTLAELYDPDLMPFELLLAHQKLDKAVEDLYRDRPFRNSSDRLEHLFKLYEKLVSKSNIKNLKSKDIEDLW